MIDTHCHLTFPELHDRIDQVIDAARQAGVDQMISVGTTPDDARQALTIADEHPGVFATVGLHPLYALRVNQHHWLLNEMKELAAHPKVVALGEMGLDRHYPDPPMDVQQERFLWQLNFVEKSDLPVVIHNRQATQEVLEMLRQRSLPGERFVFHCFTGSQEELEAILEFGAMVSFTGVVTFKNARDLAQASDLVPMDRLMVETDAPYLTPEPYRKVKPNEPRYVVEVARFLAARRGMTLEAFTAQVDANARRFFRLPKST